MFGVDAEFSGLGGFTSPNAPLPLGGGSNRNYDDGYNRVDSSGNAGGLTWNFGYANNSQINAGAGTLDLSINNSVRSGSVTGRDDPHPGLQLLGYYEIGEVDGISFSSGEKSRWGMVVGTGYNDVSIGNSSGLSSGVIRTTDSFATGGVILPAEPYNGTAAGPGPLISDNPVRTTTFVPGGASIIGSRELDVDLFTLSMGAYLDIPIHQKFSMIVEGGLLLGVASGEYSFSSVTAVPGAPAQTSTGRNSETELLGGFFLGVSGHYQISENWGALAGLQYRYLSNFNVSAAGSQASLNFDTAFMATLGVTYSF